MDLELAGCEGVDWIRLRVGLVEHCNERLGFVRCVKFPEQVVLSKSYSCTRFNPLETEMKHHIRIQFIHRREHCVLALEKPVGECCIMNSRCLFYKSYGIHKYTVWSNYGDFNVQPGGTRTSNYYSSLRCRHGVLFHNVQKCEVYIFLTLPLICVPHFPVIYLVQFTLFSSA
jgi:hypothetical protein